MTRYKDIYNNKYEREQSCQSSWEQETAVQCDYKELLSTKALNSDRDTIIVITCYTML